ncbi:MAG TPA: alpha/beta fold hydrolase [Pyrinomonadaceae bacterium]|nr:alpha/beta fold hydrolase [Pyrinomonadaceae bacterium]
MSDPAPIFEFGEFSLDASGGLLRRRDGAPVALPPKAFETLLVLVEGGGAVLSKDELMRRIWGDTFVEENNLSQNISLLRKALDDGTGFKYIETIPRRGYRLAAAVRVRSVAAPLSQTRAPVPFFDRPPETKYAKSGDVNIAYQTLGEGSFDLVFVMGWVSHLEYFWREPRFARFLARLASFSRLILFDKRGTGLSDRVPIRELPTLEQRMDDVRAVLEAAGSERAALVGVSEGGPMCSLFAATYPEKTLALVMIGTYAKRVWHPDYPWAPTAAERRRFYELLERDWGGPVGLDERAPSLKDDVPFREWWATYLRSGASPGAALALTKMNAEIDVRHVLPSISVPALVLHRAGDLCLKVEEGRYVASRIPGARFVELPGEDHLPFVGDQDAILDEVERFLVGVRHSFDPERVLATVLYAFVVEDSLRAGVDDDAAGASETDLRARLAQYQEEARREVVWFRGREVRTSEGATFAIFDGPARAIRCACRLLRAAERAGLRIKAGLHTGECDVTADGVGGVAVSIAAQVAAHAEPGEALASSTVKDLVAGSGIGFRERGAQPLAGVPGEWRLCRIEQETCT